MLLGIELQRIRFPSNTGFSLLLVLLISVLSFLPASVDAQTRYYAGYYFGDGYYGVSGDIYTISPSVSGANFVCQWINIIISYSRYYWIQVGYNKGFDTDYQLKFYVERNDANGYSIHWVADATPSAGTIYTYIIVGGIFNGKYGWDVSIREGIYIIYDDIFYTSPYAAEDLQAFSESTTSKINIDGTHFSGLSYYTGRGFPLWYQHTAEADSPYYIIEISDYEFTAGGGG